MECRMVGCSADGLVIYAIALDVDGGAGDSSVTECGRVCLYHGAQLMNLLGTNQEGFMRYGPSELAVPAPQGITAITHEFANEATPELNNGADAVIIRIDKRKHGL